LNKFTNLLEFIQRLFDEEETAKKAAEIIKGMI
jgi:hypothetical protein